MKTWILAGTLGVCALLANAQTLPDSQTVTIVLSLAKQVVGIVVDAVSDVVELKGEDIKPAPDFTGAIDTQQVIGIATIEQDQRQRMLILMDIEKLMSSAEMGLISQNEVAA